jgi:hypothetical protein
MDSLEPSARGTLSSDTSADAEALQIQRWREISDLEKADLFFAHTPLEERQLERRRLGRISSLLERAWREADG